MLSYELLRHGDFGVRAEYLGHVLPPDAGRLMFRRVDRNERRVSRSTRVDGVRAPRRVRAAHRETHEVGWRAWDGRDAPECARDARYRAQQADRIRMTRPVEHVVDIGLFDHTPRVHRDHAI